MNGMGNAIIGFLDAEKRFEDWFHTLSEPMQGFITVAFFTVMIGIAAYIEGTA